jgi:lysyl endopeptidase
MKLSRMLACPMLLLLAFGGVANATPQADGPTAAKYPVLNVNQVDSVRGETLDLQRIGAEDMDRDQKGVPPRFAIPQQVSLSPANSGTWETLGDGLSLWRLRIQSGGEVNSLNLGFTRFSLPANARLAVYATDTRSETFSFTAADNERHGQLWTPVVLTNDLMIELTVPTLATAETQLELGWINQGYRGFGTVSHDSYLKSGSCNLDVACLDAGDTWREEMRAVGVMSTGGSTFCTGSLINNTAGDRKMYFVTAAHCSINSGNAASLVVYWNFQNSFCRAPGSTQSGQAGNGTLTQFHTGSIFRAANTPSDFTLVELDDPAVNAYNPYWAGWNRTAGDYTCTAGSPCAAIHHPSTDEKRITYVIVNTATTSYSGTTSPGDGTHVWAKWAVDPPGPYTIPGVTEPGSSGSPLYDASGRFIGQLHGGPSSCGATGNNLSDYYGRFGVSWTGGGTNSTRASNWLDPAGTGATTLAGLDTGGGGGNTAPSVNITAPANGSSYTQGANVTFTGTATDTQDGTLTSSISWSSSISGALGTGGSVSTSALAVGTHTITASVTDSGSLVGSASITVNINATTGVLTNGVAVTGISGATGSTRFFTLVVPSGATNLSFVTSGGTGDMDLYVRLGSAPTTTTYDCRSQGGANAESCPFPSPGAGTWHVMLYGYAAFSGAQLTGSFTTGGGGPVTVTFYSVAAEDGRIYENTETSNVGGGGNASDSTTSAARVGDFSDDTQYRSIFSFDTSSIPDGATVTAATLRIKRGSLTGTSPFTTHGTCTVDMSSAFGGNVAFANGDFEAAASASGVASMSHPASNGTFSTGTLNAAGRTAVNKTGKTQFRVYMTLEDNDDAGSDYMGFYTGEAAAGNRPELVITYTP